MTDYKKLKVAELKDLLTQRGLGVSGKKDDLIARLEEDDTCLLYTSPSPRDVEESRMPSSA